MVKMKKVKTNGGVYFFWFALEKPRSSSMWNWVTMFTFFCLGTEIQFLEK